MMFLFYFQVTDLVKNNNRTLFLLLFPIILFDTTETPHLASTAIEEIKIRSMHDLQNYYLIQSAGNHGKAAEMLGLTNEIVGCFQSKLL